MRLSSKHWFYKCKEKIRETFHVSLSEEELEILTEVKLSERLDYNRDLFLICVYLGQRYSDYSRINKKYIEGDNINIRAKKTGQFSYIPLSRKLKTISSQSFNEAIQDICRITGFDETIQTDTKNKPLVLIWVNKGFSKEEGTHA